MRTSKTWYVADFETTGQDYYEENGYTKVWLYAICDNNANIVDIGDSIEKFFVFLRAHTCKTYYFHNLKFDGSFILDYLLNNNYTFYDSEDKAITKGFSLLIGDMGQWYSMTICFNKGHSVRILDSLKILPFKVEKIAKDFNLPILKERIDYSDYTIDEDRIRYVSHDVKIVAMAIKILRDEGLVYTTTASNAYHDYQNTLPDYVIREFDPELDKEWLVEWRAAYRGGRTQVNPYYARKLLRNVYRYDINSMYPWVMYTQPMPYGKPIPITTMGKYKFEVYHFKMAFTLKDGHLPTLLKKSTVFGTDSYYIDTEGIEDIYITSPDYLILKRHYDIQFEDLVEGFGFYCSTNIFKKYIDKWYKRKQVDEGAKRVIDKLMLNSLYGKFGSNCEGKHKIPSLVDGEVKLTDSPLQDMRRYYLPRALAIVSWAHLRIDDGILDAGIENFVYCDTDSIHTLAPMSKKYVDDKKLGYYKLEAVEDRSKYIRQKTYIYHSKKEGYVITCAGMSNILKEMYLQENASNPFKAFDVGLKLKGKLLPKRVKGGTILYETTFEIKV